MNTQYISGDSEQFCLTGAWNWEGVGDKERLCPDCKGLRELDSILKVKSSKRVSSHGLYVISSGCLGCFV